MGETTNTEFPPATFEEVWALTRENAQQFKEIREQSKKDREEMKEIREQMKETGKQMGYLNNRFGELVEHLIVPNMTEKFNELGFDFVRSLENLKIRESGNPNTLAEIDILLESDNIALAIEVKAKPKQGDVDDFLLKMGVLRRNADKRGDRRKFQGALAGAIMGESVRAHALKCGFYVVEQTGDTVRIVTPEGFKPREWSFEDGQTIGAR